MRLSTAVIRRTVYVVCLAAGAFSSGLGARQQTSQTTPAGQQRPPIFRGGAAFVSVDVYPRRDGKIVDGLTAKDFQVFEDGKPQAVESFEFVRIAPNPADEERRDPTSVADSERQAADPHNRLFVVYLDFFHTTLAGSHTIRRPIVDFLTRTIGATDLFGVMTPDIPVSQLTFGRRTETFEQELATYWTWGQDRDTVMTRNAYESFIENCFINRLPDLRASQALVDRIIRLRREDDLFTSLENLVVRLGVLRDERKNVLMLTGLFIPRPPQPELRQYLWNEMPQVGVGSGGRIGLGASQAKQGQMDHTSCDTELSRLAAIDFARRFRDLLDASRRANVAFFPVDTEGLRVSASLAAQATLQELAENTDGDVVINTNDLSAGLRKVADNLSAYYLLGYYSTNTAADGRFRRIEVKVADRGLDVTARRGYLAPSAADRRTEAAAATRGASAPATPAPITDELNRLARIRTDVPVSVAAVPSPGAIDVVAEVAGADMARGRWARGAEVQVEVRGADDAPVSAKASIEAGARGAVVHVPLTAAQGGPWRVKVHVADAQDAVDEQVTVDAADASVVSAAVAYRATPSPRSPLRAVADSQYRRTERAHFEWTIGASALDDRTARLLDRRGQPLPLGVTLSEREVDGRRVIAGDVNLAPLSEGDYVVELTVTAGGATTLRYAAFRVVR